MTREEKNAELFTEFMKEMITPESVQAKMQKSQKLKKEFDKGLSPSYEAMHRQYNFIID
ncbi:MAG: hypothetical protein KDJ35_04690 [Alphaproteobacteria bacterium]|nr:hypothetical protein [Alphaproteobacteria bacterium]